MATASRSPDCIVIWAQPLRTSPSTPCSLSAWTKYAKTIPCLYNYVTLCRAQVIAAYKSSLGEVEIVNIGGGLGINYYHEESKDTPTFADLSNAVPASDKFTIMVEPGRSLVGNTGVLMTKVWN